MVVQGAFWAGLLFWPATLPLDPGEARRLALARREGLFCPGFKELGVLDSESELRLGAALAASGLRFYAQQVVPGPWGPEYDYIVDLAYFDPERCLAIAVEVDGSFKFEDERILENLARLDSWLSDRGWYTLRFHARDCYWDPASVAEAVWLFIEQAEREHDKQIERWLHEDSDAS